MGSPKPLTQQEQTKLIEQQGKQIDETMQLIKHRIVVFSGKGGVGKTTVAVNLAYALQKQGMKVGLLDADITGPNVPQMVGITEMPIAEGGTIEPNEKNGLKVISLAPMLPPEAPVIWRGPLRSKAIEQFLGEVRWGELDYLIADLPPGTGDEVLTIAQRMSPHMAVVVTTPQEVALVDARRAVNMAKKVEIKKIGIVENMSGLICPHCGEKIDLFGAGTGRREALQRHVEFLGTVPIDPTVRRGADVGQPIILANPSAGASEAFHAIASRMEGLLS
jgi:ATP-binding protein involved in chromosome partitioning